MIKKKDADPSEKKPLKLDIKKSQIAQAVNLKGIKEKLSLKKVAPAKEHAPVKKSKGKGEEEAQEEGHDLPKIKARSKSAFAGEGESHEEGAHLHEEAESAIKEQTIDPAPKLEIPVAEKVEAKPQEPQRPTHKPVFRPAMTPIHQHTRRAPEAPREKLGPTGRHVKDLVPPKRPTPPPRPGQPPSRGGRPDPRNVVLPPTDKQREGRRRDEPPAPRESEGKRQEDRGAAQKGTKFREFKSVQSRPFDSRDRKGLTAGDENFRYRKKRTKMQKSAEEDTTIRPSSLKIRLPISLKDLAQEMKLKASELIAKLFKTGIIATINHLLEDETTVQLLGHDLGCEITVDTSEEERIRITDKSIVEEIQATDSSNLITRAPIVAFMGHVDHGKTSLIDKIRSSNVAAGEAGAITQHIGAFRCHTAVGDIAILDTPGHEAFSAMRSRGATVTDIVVLVVAGDEGIRQQTLEALSHAKEAKVTIVVAINKCDKPGFNAENVYRQLSENELLPEAWGGTTITVNCSAKTGEGIPQLLEMLALQAEVLELKASPGSRARGTVLESEMHKGLGAVATVLVQNGTLRPGDAIVLNQFYGRVKTMRDEFGKHLKEAGPSTPVEITGLSGIPDAGTEFIAVSSEKEAREIAESRALTMRQKSMQKKGVSIESMMASANESKGKKIFNVLLSADVQGSLEALKTALEKIHSDKIDLNIVSAEVGEVSESIVQMAQASGATIIGFHTKVESHAEPLAKAAGVNIKLHDIIYHAVDEVKEMMRSSLDKIPIENEKGKAEVRQTFKASHLGVIAGCYITEGTIARNNYARLRRGEEIIWKGSLASLKRIKEDVREVSKGFECGILLAGYNQAEAGDIIEAYEINYLEQEL